MRSSGLRNLLGLDQDELTFPHLGRDERLTLVHGSVIDQIVDL